MSARRSFRSLGRLQLSIRTILLVITAALTLLIMLLSARDIASNIQRLQQTYALRQGIEVSDKLFAATNAISVERDLALAMLQAGDAETRASLISSLNESRRATDTAVSAAASALDRQRLTDLAPLRSEFARGYNNLRASRARIDAVLQATRPDRVVSGQWQDATTGLMDDVERLWVSFIRPYASIDAVVTQHLRYRHMLRTITDYSGRERSIIGQILSQSAPASSDQTATLLRAQGELDLAWRTARVLAQQSGLFASIAPEFGDAESHYATLDGMTRTLFVPGARRGDYPIGPDVWFELSSQAADSLAILRDVSQRATQRYLGGLIDQTEGAILAQASIALIALLLCVASFWIIVGRVINPINRIARALTAATRGEAAEFERDPNRTDEIGQLARVLDALKANLEATRALAAERDSAAQGLAAEVEVRRAAEERAQAQLGRLALLHRISRAIGERQDLDSIFAVALADLENELPAAFVCVGLLAPGAKAMRIARVGLASMARAASMSMSEGAVVEIGANGLSRCMNGRLVYEADLGQAAFPFPERLAQAGLKSLVAAPLQVESQVLGALIVARLTPDAFSSGECEFLRQLSEHIALAAHQAQLNTALQQAYDELRLTQDAVMQQERLKALGQMASGIAHDINNALSPIALYTESLLNTERNLSEAGRGKLEIVQRAIDDAARTIARMNEFYRKRDTQLMLTPVDVNAMVAQVLELTEARWRDMPQERGHLVEMRKVLDEDIAPILGVESELREALTNLVFNAVDALPKGGIVTVSTRRAPAGQRPAGVDIEVRDNGIGMDEVTRRRCLEPFYTTKGERGTGLGLAMVYGMVQRHGGDIDIESAVGLGTAVHLHFAAAPSGLTQPALLEEARPNRRLRLLVVDDDPILLRSLRDVLESDGHVVASAPNGEMGIAAFEAALKGPQPFDAVITDLGMPGLDGRRVAGAVKQMSTLTPVILLTGWGERMKAEDDMPEHVDFILSKPPKVREVRAALAKSCEGSIEASGLTRGVAT